MATGQGNDFLDVACENKRYKQIEEVHLSDDIDVEKITKILLKDIWRLTPTGGLAVDRFTQKALRSHSSNGRL